jgi:DNA-binding transcriptional ArsR family regulator/uncharacterized protein YndB with AHSA1/START domain
MSSRGQETETQLVLSALASPIRREILSLIWEHELPAGEIASAFELSAPTISGHLSVLRRAGLVAMTAQGTFRRYRARREVVTALQGTLGKTFKWTPVRDLPEQRLATARTTPVVVATVEVETDQATTFRAVTDPAVYSRWLGVPVRIKDGRFSCTMEWGTRVRGRYEIVHPPELIAMAWDFEDDNVPLPGGEMVGYLRVTPTKTGSHVEVHQLVERPDQADFMEVAWSVVLGRLREGVVAAGDPERVMASRRRRTKHHVPGQAS